MTISTELLVTLGLGSLVAVLGYFMREMKKSQDEKNSRYDAHLASCNERNERAAREDGAMEAKIQAIQSWADETKDKVDWLCESMAAIAAKVKAPVPKLTDKRTSH
jgi:hypothetical protein